MNPELPQVRSSNEMMPQIPGSAEFFPDGTMQSPEVAVPRVEQGSVQVEQLSQSAQAAAPMPVASPYAPLQQPVAPPAQAPLTADDTTPALAADDDLIEKEWVDKVKKIIALTKGKPYEQAQAVAALQADYLKKRYNRVLGESDGR